jgi:RNA polymerase sigma-70 factor (ECF subfamily)
MSLLDALKRQLPDALDDEEVLEAALAEMIEQARRAFPDVQLNDEVFVAHIARHVPEGVPLARALAQLSVADLYLACACTRGDEAATRAFEADYRDTLRAVIARGAPEATDEVCQRVLEHLLVGDPPALVSYAGRGRLRAWLRVVATRELYAHMRKEKRHRGKDVDELVERIEDTEADPELADLKRRYRREFKRAFAEAFATLSVRERNLLRHDLLDGSSTEAIAKLYGVHRASIARWRADLRAKLLSETQRYFRERERLDAGKLESILRLIDSQLEVSLFRLLDEEKE